MNTTKLESVLNLLLLLGVILGYGELLAPSGQAVERAPSVVESSFSSFKQLDGYELDQWEHCTIVEGYSIEHCDLVVEYTN